MTLEDLINLNPGDVVKHASKDSDTYIVTGNYGGRVIAVRIADLTNPTEWILVSKVNTRANPRY